MKYSYLTTIPFSLFSRELYRDVFKRWEGWGMKYLLSALALIFAVPVVVKAVLLYQLYANEGAPGTYRDTNLLGTDIKASVLVDIIDQFPPITLHEGKISIAAPQPYVIYHRPTNTPVIVIDTTGQTKEIEGHKNFALLTSDAMLIRDERGEVQRMEFAKAKTETIVDKKTLLSWLRLEPFFYYPLVIITQFIMMIANAGFLGIGAMFLARWMKVAFDYRDAVRITAVTTTPIILFEAFSALTDIQLFTNPSLIYLMMQAAYIYHAVESNKYVKAAR